MGKDQDEFMDLTQDDDGAELPVIGFPRSRTSSTSTEPYELTQCEEPLPTQASKGKGKGKGKGKRTNTGSVQNNAKKKAKVDKMEEKQRLASEKAAKKATADMNKIYRPTECMKYMNIEMHPVLASAWYMADVSREAAALGARVSQAGSLCDPGLVMWTRSVQPRLAAEGGQVALTSSKEPCGPSLYVTVAQDIQDHVSAHTLTRHIAQIKEMVATELTVVIFGVKEFFKTSGRKTSNSSRKLMTDIDLEMAITDLLVTAGCDTVVVNSPNELALLIVQFTKAIAEAPHKKAKRACDEQAEFYMKGDNKNCIGVDPDGNGLARLWQQMVAILPLSSLEVSRAVCGQYKSPLMLYEELQSRGVSRVADVGVSRAGVPGARARRVGPEFAQKLYSLFTDDCGNVLIH